METFRDKLNRGSLLVKYNEYKRYYVFASNCLEVASTSKSNRNMYDALTHLALVPELDIPLIHYEYLINQPRLPFDEEVLSFAKRKLCTLKNWLDGGRFNYA